MNEPVLDRAMVDSLQDLLGEKFNVMVDAYLSDCSARLDRLKCAIEGELDLTIVKNEAHGIKGSSRNLGANPLADICALVENKARAGDASELAQNISAIEKKFAAVGEVLSEYKA